jgi:hypothetical protein
MSGAIVPAISDYQIVKIFGDIGHSFHRKSICWWKAMFHTQVTLKAHNSAWILFNTIVT